MSENTVPWRLAVMRAVREMLSSITPANGYHHDLSQNVYIGRDVYGEDDPLPLVGVLEAPQGEGGNSPEDRALYKNYWELLVQGFTEDDRLNPTEPAYLLQADVMKCLAQARREVLSGGIDNPNFCFGLGNRGVVSVEIERPVVRPSDELSSKAYFWLVLRLKIAENMDDPYKY